MPTYFGQTSEGASFDGTAGGTAFANVDAVWTAPGSGNQTLKELSAFVKSLGGTPNNMRCAIYSSDGNTKIAEGTAEVAVTSTTESWVGHTTQASMTPNPATLTGGTNYRIAVSFDGADARIAYTGGIDGNVKSEVSDYTGGFPATFSPAANYVLISLRAGVDAEAGGRTTKNTRSNPLGIEIGMGWRMPL